LELLLSWEQGRLATMENNRRSSARNRSFIRGRIQFNNGQASFDCLVRDLSQTGARLAVTGSAPLPDVFELLLPSRDARFRAQVRWRHADDIGVAFLNADAPLGAAPHADPMSRLAELEAENAKLRKLVDQLRAELRKAKAEYASLDP
jgi:PilZ domain